jgi:hypothetical protein
LFVIVATFVMVPPDGFELSGVTVNVTGAALPALSVAVAVTKPVLAAPAAQLYVSWYGGPALTTPPAGVHSTPAPSRSGNVTFATPTPASLALMSTRTLPACAGL